MILTLALSCTREETIITIAEENLPELLDREMKFYMGTVEKPEIKDLAVVYSCDSLCVLQCHASAKDSDGRLQSENIRYIFVKDTFMSAFEKDGVYCHAVQGAPYLDKQGIEDFCKKMRENPQEMYLHYLSSSEPLVLFK